MTKQEKPVLTRDQKLSKFTALVKKSGFPLEHWASSLLRREGWLVTTNFYYIDSDEKKPREMDIVAHKKFRLERFTVTTVLMISCKKSETSAWGFLRREFPEVGNQKDLFPVNICLKYPPVINTLKPYEWTRDYCDYMSKHGLERWFGHPRYDVFGHQQIPHSGEGRLNDSDMHSSTLQLIKAQAYEMSDDHHYDHSEIKQFNLISLTDGEFVAFNFDDENEIKAVEINEQVALSSYKIDGLDSDSRIIYITKERFEKDVSMFEKIHETNVKFFNEREAEFRTKSIYEPEKLRVRYSECVVRIKECILSILKRGGHSSMLIPKVTIELFADSPCDPVVEITSMDDQILEIAHSPDFQDSVKTILDYFWGYFGPVDFKAIKGRCCYLLYAYCNRSNEEL